MTILRDNKGYHCDKKGYRCDCGKLSGAKAKGVRCDRCGLKVKKCLPSRKRVVQKKLTAEQYDRARRERFQGLNSWGGMYGP